MIDEMFGECIREELRDGNDMTIQCSAKDERAWRRFFTPLELRHLTFERLPAPSPEPEAKGA